MSSPFPTQNPNRASLLAGLRTGGVRPPQSAAPTAATFDPQQLGFPPQQFQNRGFMTSAVDGPNNSFAAQQQQQQGQLNPYHFQQAMQLEMLKMQAFQAQAQQQQQIELIRQQQQNAQAQAQTQQQQQQQRRASFQPPATAGPTGSFDIRSPAPNNGSLQIRRQPEQRSLQPQASFDQAPMTARLDGRFGTRSTSMPLNPASNGTTTVISGGTSLGSMASNNVKESAAPSKSDSASSWRRGASSGNSALNAIRERNAASTSPSGTAVPPALNLSRDRSSPPLISEPPMTAPASSKRPKPLSFTLAAHKPMIPEVLIDTSEAEEDDSSSNSSRSSNRGGSGKSSPTTSSELLSIGEVLPNPPLSPRAEASKRLYEGLSMGRPRSHNSDNGELQAPPSPRAFSMNVQPPQTAGLFPSHDSGFNVNSSFPQSPFVLAPVPHTASLSGPNYSQHRLDRSANQPKRQPRGPPSNQEELVPLNFAARSPRLPPSTASLVGSMQSLAVEAY